MPYKGPKLKLKKQKMPKSAMKEAEFDKDSVSTAGGKLKLAKIPKKKKGKIIKIKTKGKSPSAPEMKMMRKDYMRGTDKAGKLMMEKGRLKGEREIYEKLLKGF